MNTPRRLRPETRILTRSIAALLAAAGIFSPGATRAATVTWDTVPGTVGVGDSLVTGGLGTWDLTNGNWTADGGLNNVAWVNNAPGDDAVFAGLTGGVVTLGTGITAGSVTFNTANYSIMGGTLTFDAAAPTITSNGVFGIIGSTVAGTADLSFAATGVAGTYIDGNNTYSGTTLVNSGYLVVSNANSLGTAGNGTVVASGATLQLELRGSGDVNIANEAVTISGTGMPGNRGALANWSGNNTWGGSVTMVGDSTVFVNSGNLTINSVISGGFNLTKNGTGTLTLGGSTSNTYTGLTILDGSGAAGANNNVMVLAKTGGAKAIVGNVQMGNINTIQSNLRMAENNQFAPGVVMTFVNAVNNWARFDLQGTSQTLAGLQTTAAPTVLAGAVIQNERLGGGGTTGPATLTIDNSADFYYNGYMRDRDGGVGIWLLNLVKTGVGTQTLIGTNVTYSGTTAVNGGTLRLTSTNSGSAVAVNPGGTLAINGVNTTAPQLITLNGGTLLTDENSGYVVNSKVLTVAVSSNFQINGTGTTGNISEWFADAGIAIGAGQTLTVTPSTENNGFVVRGSGASNGALIVNGVGTNSLAGRSNLQFGTNGAAQFSNTDVTLNNATMNIGQGANGDANTAGATIKNLNGNGRVVSDAVARTLTVGTNNGSGNFSGVLANGNQTLSFTKTGTGTQTLSGANTYTGATAINAGTLGLDYGTQDNSKLSDTDVLTFGGGALNLIGGSHTETVGSTTLAAGSSTSVTRTSGSAVLQMNAITRNAGAAINFGASGIATTDTLNSPSGLLGTWATVGGDWAVNSTNGADGLITAYSGYTSVNRLGGTIADGVANNVKIIEAGVAGDVTLAAAGTTTINSLLQGASGGTATVNIGVGNTLRMGAEGAIFVPSGNSGLTFNNGTLTAGGAADTAGSIEVNNGSTANGITINSVITDNGTGSVALTKLGTGTLTVTGANSHTGGTTISAGTLAFNNGSLGTTGAVTVAGGTLRWNGSNTEDVSSRIALLNGIAGSFDTNGNNVDFASAIGGGTSGAAIKAGNGTLILSGANTHTGSTTVQGGTLALNNVNALQGSTLDTGVSGPQTVTFTVAGSNTYNLGGLSGADGLEIGGNTISVGANNLTGNFSGVISGAGGSLTKVGNGTLTLSGTASNTYTGSSTFASNGQLILSKTGGAVAIPGDLIMAAPGTRGIVSTTADNQFAPGSVLRFTSAGDTRLELKGTTQTLGGIDNTTAPAHTFHAVQHSEFGSPTAVDTTSQVVLNVTGANSFTFNTAGGGTGGGVIRDFTGGVMSLVKNGTGTQTVSGAGVTYTGTTALNDGTLVLRDTTAFVSSIAVSGSGVLNSERTVLGLAGRNPIIGRGVSGTGIVNINNSGAGLAGGWTTIGVANGLTMAGTININTGTLSRDNTTVSNINTTATVNVAAGAAFGAGRGGNSTIGALNGAGDVGAFWAAANAGSITFGNGNGSGSFSGILHGNGSNATDGTLEGGILSVVKIGTGTQILSGNNTYSGTTTISAGTLQVGNGGTDGALGGGAIINNSSLVFDRSNDLTVPNVISGTGSLTKIGAGVMNLTKSSTYQGATTINGGTLKLGVTASATLPVPSAIWLDATDGATISTSGGGVVSWTNKGTLGASGDVVAAVGQEPSLISAEPAMNNQPVIHFDAAPPNGIAPFDRLTNPLDFSAGNVTIMYAGRLSGGDANQRMLAGVNNNWLLGTWNGSQDRAYFNNWITASTAGAGVDALSHIYTGTIATGGAANFYSNGALIGSGALATNQGPNGLSLGGGFSAGVGAAVTTEFSDGDIGELLVFTSVLTAQERMDVEAYLSRKWQGAANILPSNTAVSLAASGATLDLNGMTQTVGSIAGVSGSGIALGGGKLTTGGNGSSTSFAGAISGAGTVTKTGGGTWTLSGTNPNTGDVNVSGGVLNVTGALTGSTVAVHVQNGGTLGGTGSIAGAVDVAAGGFLSPGVSPGTLSVGPLDISGAVAGIGTASMLFEVGPGGDKVVITSGALTIGGGTLEFNDFAFSALPSLANGTYILFDSNTAIAGTLGASLTGNIGVNFFGTLGVDAGNNDIILTVVPEPGSAVLFLAGLGLIAGRRRRTS